MKPNICHTFQNDNVLSFYSTSRHFFIEFTCRNCNDGSYYYDRHSIFGGTVLLAIPARTLRDRFDAYPNDIVRRSLTLTDEQAVRVLQIIVKRHAETLNDQLLYRIFEYNCVEYCREILNVVLPQRSLSNFLGTHRLSGLAGAYLYAVEHPNPFTFDALREAINILSKKLDCEKSPEELKIQIAPCDRNQNYPGTFVLEHCVFTPYGQAIPVDYSPPLRPYYIDGVDNDGIFYNHIFNYASGWGDLFLFGALSSIVMIPFLLALYRCLAPCLVGSAQAEKANYDAQPAKLQVQSLR